MAYNSNYTGPEIDTGIKKSIDGLINKTIDINVEEPWKSPTKLNDIRKLINSLPENQLIVRIFSTKTGFNKLGGYAIASVETDGEDTFENQNFAISFVYGDLLYYFRDVTKVTDEWDSPDDNEYYENPITTFPINSVRNLWITEEIGEKSANTIEFNNLMNTMASNSELPVQIFFSQSSNGHHFSESRYCPCTFRWNESVKQLTWIDQGWYNKLIFKESSSSPEPTSFADVTYECYDLLNGNIDGSRLNDGSVIGSKIQDGTISMDKLEENSGISTLSAFNVRILEARQNVKNLAGSITQILITQHRYDLTNNSPYLYIYPTTFGLYNTIDPTNGMREITGSVLGFITYNYNPGSISDSHPLYNSLIFSTSVKQPRIIKVPSGTSQKGQVQVDCAIYSTNTNFDASKSFKLQITGSIFGRTIRVISNCYLSVVSGGAAINQGNYLANFSGTGIHGSGRVLQLKGDYGHSTVVSLLLDPILEENTLIEQVSCTDQLDITFAEI